MTRYILDTDTLSLYEHGHPTVSAAIRARAPGELAITVITVEEQLSGWYTLLRRAKQPHELAYAYQRLAGSVQLLAGLPILSFTEPAIARYDDLVAQKLPVGRMDLRIAAIALEVGGIVVTRNVHDFQRVPGLTVQNWAV
jgi:tRNA(fMet)-specific endonuclease VapC